jgi:sulfhydrogenase subunit beta (sulfur reductase)
VLKIIAIEKISQLAAALMDMGTLLAPVKEISGHNFMEIVDPKQVDLDFYNTIMSPKGTFFPHKEDFVKYKIGKPLSESEPVLFNMKPVFLFGVRPCDVKSFEIMDIHFNDAGIIDPYWHHRRESTTIFGYAFDLDKPVDPADFYNTLGIYAADPDGSDIFMVKKEKELLLKSITHKGEKLLAHLSVLANTSSGDEKYFEEYIKRGKEYKTRFTAVDPEAVALELEDVFDNTDFWKKISSACLSCGVCTFVCPTCYCFDICDDTLFGKGTRRRVWDACMFTDFTLEASGHNPRTQVYQRLRQKFCHKYSFHIRKYGVISCVGCGRCTRYCPVNIDIFNFVDIAAKAKWYKRL